MREVLGQPIAYGRTAEIYAWHDGEILKLFYAWVELENIETEARNTRAVHASGLPVPAVGEIVRMKDRYGLEYQRIYGESMFKLFQHKPWNIFRYARRMARLQATLHASTIKMDIPSQRQEMAQAIQHAEALPAALRSKVLAALESMPDGDRLCHGDFSPANILMTAEGEIIIDWFRASCGNPLADLARTTNLMLGFTRTAQIQRPFLTFGSTKTSRMMNSLFQVLIRICYPAYINYYFKLNPGDEHEYQRWLSIVAAARLADAIPELEQMLISQAEKYL
jgi:uncharacterized protein (TIGR02172 family)